MANTSYSGNTFRGLIASNSKICFLDKWISQQIGSISGANDFAVLQGIGMMRQAQRQSGVLFDQYDRHVLLAVDAFDGLSDFEDDLRRNAQRRLSQHQPLGVGNQGAANGPPLLLSHPKGERK